MNNFNDYSTVKEVRLYTTTLCNLRCKYCFVCKNESLSVADADIEKSFEDPNYYFNLYKETIDNDENKLKDLTLISVFGGEPLLKMKRFIPTFKTFIDNCPNLTNVHIFTNFAHSNSLEALKELNNLFKQYPNKRFSLSFQISIDGPADITNEQRGQDVTEKIIANYNKGLENDFYLADNATMTVSFKPTINHNSITKFLDTNYFINYYKFFEETFINPGKKHPRIKLIDYVITPTIASPWYCSKEDGKLVAELAKKFYEIDQLNYEQHAFYAVDKTANWFIHSSSWTHNNTKNPPNFLDKPFCPFGREILLLLPNGAQTSCIRTFADYYENYANNCNNENFDVNKLEINDRVKDLVHHSVKDLNEYRKRIDQFYVKDLNKSAFRENAIHIVQTLAKINQVDPKYVDYEEAKYAINIMFGIYSACEYANNTDCGNELLVSTSWFKMYLNGAIDYVVKDIDFLKNKGILK